MICDRKCDKFKNRIGCLVAAFAITLSASCSGPSATESSQSKGQSKSQSGSAKLDQNVVVQEELVKQSIRGKNYEKLAGLLAGSIKDVPQAIVRIRATAQDDLAALRIIYELVPSAKNTQGESPYLAQVLKRGKWDIAAFLCEQGERCDPSLFREKFDSAPSIEVTEFMAILPIFEKDLSEKDWEALWKKNINEFRSEYIQGWVDHFVKQPNEPPCRALARVVYSMINRSINVSGIPLSIFSTLERDAKVSLAYKLIRNQNGNSKRLFSGFFEDFLNDELELDQQQLEQIKLQWPEQFERMNLAEPTRWSEAFHATMHQKGDFSALEPWKDKLRILASKPLVKYYSPGQTPLQIALSQQRYDLVQWMVDHGAVDHSKTQSYRDSAALVANIELNASNPLSSNVSFTDATYNPFIRAADRHGAEYVVRVSRTLKDSTVNKWLRNQAMEKFFKAGRFDMLHAALEASELPSALLLDYLGHDQAADFLRSIPPNSSASRSLKKSLPEVLSYVCSEKRIVTTDLVFESLWRCARVEFKQRKVVSLEDLLRADHPPSSVDRSRRPIEAAKQNFASTTVERLSQLLIDCVDRPEVFRTLIWEGVPVTADTFKKVIELRKLEIAKLVMMDLNWRKQNAGLLRETLLTALEKRDTPIVEMFKVAGLEHMLTESQLASINSQLGGS